MKLKIALVILSIHVFFISPTNALADKDIIAIAAGGASTIAMFSYLLTDAGQETLRKVGEKISKTTKQLIETANEHPKLTATLLGCAGFATLFALLKSSVSNEVLLDNTLNFIQYDLKNNQLLDEKNLAPNQLLETSKIVYSGSNWPLVSTKQELNTIYAEIQNRLRQLKRIKKQTLAYEKDKNKSKNMLLLCEEACNDLLYYKDLIEKILVLITTIPQFEDQQKEYNKHHEEQANRQQKTFTILLDAATKIQQAHIIADAFKK